MLINLRRDYFFSTSHLKSKVECGIMELQRYATVLQHDLWLTTCLFRKQIITFYIQFYMRMILVFCLMETIIPILLNY